MKVSSLQVPGVREEYGGNTHPFKPRDDGASTKEIEGKGVYSYKSQFVANRSGWKKRQRKKNFGQVEIRCGLGPVRAVNRVAGRNSLHSGASSLHLHC